MKRLFIILSTVLLAFILISCTQKSFTVTFNSQGGTEVISQTVQSGKFATKPTNPTYADHTFKHWALEGTEFEFAETPIIASITLDAVWEANVDITTYTVSFDSKGGLAVTSQQVAKNGFANKPNNPTYAGHTFKHWMLNNVAFVFETTPITASITLEALWEVNVDVVTHTVTFDAKGGSTVPNQTVEDNNLATRPTAPTKALNDFSGWYIGEALYDFNTPVTSNITLEAKWSFISKDTYVELGFAEGLLKLLGVEQKILYNTKYDASITQTQAEQELSILAKIDLESDYTQRNSHIQMLYNDELQQEIFVVNGKFYIEDLIEETKYKSPDIITDQFIGNFLGIASLVDTPNYYFKSLIENFNMIDILKNLNTSNFKVYQKDNSYKVEVTLNEQTMPTAFKQIFMGSSFIEAKLTVYIEQNQITGLTVDITAEDDMLMNLSILQSAYDETYIQAINTDSYETLYEQTYVLKVNYGVDGIVQEISFDEDFKTVYEMISSDIMAFKRDGYTLEGFYFDEALTRLIDDTLMDKIEVDLVANIYLKWIPTYYIVEELVTFGDTGNFMALEPYENPSVLEGIYQLNEYIVFVGIYSQFDGYAVAYNTQTSQYYLIYEEGDDLLAIKYEDVADLTLLITELTTLNGSDFMKFGDLNIEQHKAILTMDNSITLLNGGYKLYYNTFYLNTYDPSTFEAYYNNLHHALTHNLLVEDIVIQDMYLDSNNQYYDDELGRSVLILDKDYMVDGLNIQLRDSAGMTKRFKLADLDLGSYTLTYTYNEDLTPILVDLTYQGFEISFYVILYDYDTYGSIYIINGGVGYVSNFLTEFSVPPYVVYKEVYLNGRYYEAEDIDLTYMHNLLLQSEYEVNNLEMYTILNNYTYFLDYISTIDMVVIDEMYGDGTAYYNIKEDILFSEDFILSFGEQTVTYTSLNFSLSVPRKDFNITAFLESLLESTQYEFDINLDDLLMIRSIYNGDNMGTAHNDGESRYIFDNQYYDFTLDGDGISFNFERLKIKALTKIVEAPAIVTQGLTYELTNDQDDSIIYLTFDNLQMDYYDRFEYVPNNYYRTNIQLNNETIETYYREFGTTTTGYVIHYEQPYVVDIELISSYRYFDDTLNEYVFLVHGSNPLASIKVDITYNNNYTWHTDLSTLEEFTSEMVQVIGNMYTLEFNYEGTTREIYIDKHDYVIDGQVFIINSLKYSYSNLDGLATTNISTLYSIDDMLNYESMETIGELKAHILDTNKDIYVLHFEYDMKDKEAVLDALASNIFMIIAHDKTYYIDLENQILIGENFTSNVEGDYIIYQSNDMVYEFLVADYNELALLDALLYDDWSLIVLFRTLNDALDGIYIESYKSNDYITFDFGGQYLEIDAYEDMMWISIQSPYLYTRFTFTGTLPKNT